MFDCTKDLQEFYDGHVRLGAELRGDLAAARDLNLQRLVTGLEELGAQSRTTYAGPIATKNQGGYAMHTLNQSDEYDIDVALIFRKSDLPDDPLKARQRVRDALQNKCTNFTKEPEARTNAVTVWYQDGYHIDFAVYRTWEELDGWRPVTRIEHASTSWKPRDPDEINKWFADTVAQKSPSTDAPHAYPMPNVRSGQLRRIVRFLKRFCRSRSSYCLPGGMIVSTLIAEVYVSDGDRDDIALYRTLESLRDRLMFSTRVVHPLDSTVELTSKPEHLNEVERLKRELDKHFPRLSVLKGATCTHDQARTAWDWIFNHEFWHPVARKREEALRKILQGTALAESALPYSAAVTCKLTRAKDLPAYALYKSDGKPLPKGIGLRFSLERTNCPEPYDTHWFVNNEGAEAEEAHQLSWDRYEPRCETSTKFRGRQTMTCRLEKSGKTVAETAFIVNIV
jgi:hypothetical protein